MISDDDEQEDADLTGSEDESSRDSVADLLDTLETGTPLSSLLLPSGQGAGGETKQGEGGEETEADQKMNDVAALAESIQPKGENFFLSIFSISDREHPPLLRMKCITFF